MDKALARNLIQRVNVGDSLTRTAARTPDKLAVVDGIGGAERRWSYRELNNAVNRFAHGLLARGYKHGDALALGSGNSIEFLVTYFACTKIGVVCVPLNLGWGANEIAYALEHSRARGIVMETQLAPLVGAAVKQVEAVREVIVAPGTKPDADVSVDGRENLSFDAACADNAAEPEVIVGERDPISYLYTSGTTSAPKGVMSSHVPVYVEALMMAAEIGISRNDRVACLMPLFHTAQLNGFATTAVMIGCTQYLMRGFDPTVLLDLIEAEEMSVMFLMPMMWQVLMDHPTMPRRDVSSLRKAAYAMAPMPDALLRRCMERLDDCGFFLAFGQTEMNPVTTLFRPEDQFTHLGAVGSQVPNVQVGFMDENGKLLPRGQEGEFVYRGPHAMEGYLRNPEATDKAFEHGWFHSGDVGYMGEDGMCWFTDRYKDVIKSGGENVASIEVEKAIYAAAEAVSEVVVIGVPHPHWVEAIIAIVTVKEGHSLDVDALLVELKKNLAIFKVPKDVIVVDEIPKTATGKLRKNVMRKQYKDYFSEGGAKAG